MSTAMDWGPARDAPENWPDVPWDQPLCRGVLLPWGREDWIKGCSSDSSSVVNGNPGWRKLGRGKWVPLGKLPTPFPQILLPHFFLDL